MFDEGGRSLLLDCYQFLGLTVEFTNCEETEGLRCGVCGVGYKEPFFMC